MTRRGSGKECAYLEHRSSNDSGSNDIDSDELTEGDGGSWGPGVVKAGGTEIR